ncbi:hypothetical protein PUN28_001780 [Cardiocondyla obscurior]|uniref:Uncharacterized protein n=1 Tax=Cardiocondyla obscurior TaxID=286306 RepID=A0AAW2GR50_9HYME
MECKNYESVEFCDKSVYVFNETKINCTKNQNRHKNIIAKALEKTRVRRVQELREDPVESTSLQILISRICGRAERTETLSKFSISFNWHQILCVAYLVKDGHSSVNQ